MESTGVSKLEDGLQSGKPLFTRKIQFLPAKHREEDTAEKYRRLSVGNASTSKKSSDNEKVNHDSQRVNASSGRPSLPKELLNGPERAKTPLASYSLCVANHEWKDIPPVGSGLMNLGNTCFMNSVLQCMIHTPSLVNYLRTGQYAKDVRKKTLDFSAPEALSRQIDHSLKSSGRAIAPKTFAKNLRNICRRFQLGRQEDAHEFARYLVESLQKPLLPPPPSPKGMVPTKISQTTYIGHTFGGYFRSQVHCTSCGHNSDTFDPFMDVSLDIKKGVDSLTDAFENFVTKEKLDDLYRCDGCKQKVKATKQLTIHEAPNVLMIQLKRFDFNGGGSGFGGHFHGKKKNKKARFGGGGFFGFGGGGGKIDRHIEFKERLDLRPFISAQARDTDALYELYGIVVHSLIDANADGFSANSGHYVAYVRSAAGTFHCMDDETVRQVGIGSALKQKAYLLFYRRIRPRMGVWESHMLKFDEQSQSSTPTQQEGRFENNEPFSDVQDGQNNTMNNEAESESELKGAESTRKRAREADVEPRNGTKAKRDVQPTQEAEKVKEKESRSSAPVADSKLDRNPEAVEDEDNDQADTTDFDWLSWMDGDRMAGSGSARFVGQYSRILLNNCISRTFVSPSVRSARRKRRRIALQAVEIEQAKPSLKSVIASRNERRRRGFHLQDADSSEASGASVRNTEVSNTQRKLDGNNEVSTMDREASIQEQKTEKTINHQEKSSDETKQDNKKTIQKGKPKGSKISYNGKEVRFLLRNERNSVFSAQVDTWDEEIAPQGAEKKARESLIQQSMPRLKERFVDDYDRDYDKGKVKKQKTNDGLTSGNHKKYGNKKQPTGNPFVKAAERRKNIKKDRREH